MFSTPLPRSEKKEMIPIIAKADIFSEIIAPNVITWIVLLAVILWLFWVFLKNFNMI